MGQSHEGREEGQLRSLTGYKINLYKRNVFECAFKLNYNTIACLICILFKLNFCCEFADQYFFNSLVGETGLVNFFICLRAFVLLYEDSLAV